MLLGRPERLNWDDRETVCANTTCNGQVELWPEGINSQSARFTQDGFGVMPGVLRSYNRISADPFPGNPPPDYSYFSPWYGFVTPGYGFALESYRRTGFNDT